MFDFQDVEKAPRKLLDDKVLKDPAQEPPPTDPPHSGKTPKSSTGAKVGPAALEPAGVRNVPVDSTRKERSVDKGQANVNKKISGGQAERNSNADIQVVDY